MTLLIDHDPPEEGSPVALTQQERADAITALYIEAIRSSGTPLDELLERLAKLLGSTTAQFDDMVFERDAARAAIRESRDAALEEAARVCDWRARSVKAAAGAGLTGQELVAAAQEHAAAAELASAIRALKAGTR